MLTAFETLGDRVTDELLRTAIAKDDLVALANFFNGFPVWLVPNAWGIDVWRLHDT